MAHLASLALALRLHLLGRERGGPIDVVVANAKAAFCSDLNQLLGDVWGDGLAALVMTNIALRTPEGVSHGLLSHLQPFSDGADRIHAGIVAALLYPVNTCARPIKNSGANNQ